MEKYEILNEALRPADHLLELSFQAMRRANLYEPFKKTLYAGFRGALGANFKLSHNLRIFGAENVPAEGGVLLASNHASWLDAQVVTVACPRKVCFLAKADFTDWPLLHHLIDLSDAVYIRRGGDDETLRIIASRLEEGACVGIFPEGTIPGEEDVPRWEVEPETGLLRGKSGVVRLALKAGVPIVPVGLTGTGKAFPPEAYPRLEQLPLPKPEPIEVRFGEPIRLKPRKDEDVGYEQLRGMTERVMREISRLIDHSKGFEPLVLPITSKEAPTTVPPTPYRNEPVQERQKFGVLILHGFTSHVNCVADLRFPMEEMGLPYRIPVLRGHGGKWQDLQDVKAEDWFEDAENSMLDLLSECRRVIVVGLSMGGLVALDLAARHRKKVAAVVAVAPALKFKDPLAGLTPLMAKLFKSWPSPNAFVDKSLKKQRNRNYPRFATSAFLELYRYTTRVENSLSFVVADTLILHSNKDQVVHPKSARIIEAKISSKNKRTVWFEESGHEMLLDLESSRVMGTIASFIGEKVRAARGDSEE